MKKISLLILTLIAFNCVLRAQEEKKESNKGPKITIFSFDINHLESCNSIVNKDSNGNICIFSRDKKDRYNKFDGHWSGFELGFTRYIDAPKEFLELSKGKSSQVNLNIIESSFGITDNIGFVTGLGIQWNNYRFSDDVTLVKAYDNKNQRCYTEQNINLPGKERDVIKSKLTTSYITIPLLFEIQSKYNRGKFIQAGIVGGINIGAHTKIKYGNGDKDKDFDNFGINQFKCDATLRLGISPFNLWFSYGLTDIFDKNELYNSKTKEYLNLTPWSFGFSIFF
ncbi:PorT family protein [Marinilabiliaceae bacterium JC040]|nr:PorT family protein [Marinilabiliaceae bacterium JC040]